MKKILLWTKNCILSFYNMPHVILNRDSYSEVQKYLAKIIGEKATEGFFYRFGKLSLKPVVLEIINREGLKDYTKRIELFFQYALMCGFGKFIIEELDLEKRFLKIRVLNSFNSVGFSNSKKPVCHFLRGMIAGALEIIFNEGIDVVEKECVAMGSKKCIFEARPSGKRMVPVRELERVQRARNLKPVKLKVDEKTGILFHKGAKSYLFYADVRALSQIEFEKLIGERAAAGIYFRISVNATLRSLRARKRLIRFLSLISKKFLMKKLAKQFCEMGYGLLDFSYDKKAKKISIKVRNSFIARFYKEKRKNPVCHTVRGILAGAISMIFNRPFEIKETKCLAKGDKYCFFECKLK